MKNKQSIQYLFTYIQQKQHMYIYIGGKWADREIIHKYIMDVFNLGHQISHDWTHYNGDITMDDMVSLTVDGNVDEQTMIKLKASRSADKDICGVRNASIVVIVMTDPTYEYRGSFTELGAALALEKEIYVICPDSNAKCRTNVFFHHPRIQHLNSFDEFLTILSSKDVYVETNSE